MNTITARESTAKFPTPSSVLKRHQGDTELPTKMAEVKLFRTWSSPFPLRIIWALKLKDIQYDTIFEDLTNKSPLLLQYNPVHKKVPVLLHNGKPVSESLVILEYIEETWKEYPLLSEDPHERAAARFWAKFGDEKVLTSVWEAFNSEGEKQEEEILKAKENLKYLEGELNGKKFFGGEQIGFVDIALGWLTLYLDAFEEVTSMNLITEGELPSLSKWKQNFAATPIVKDTFPPRDKHVTRYQAFRDTSLSKNVPK